MTTNYAKDMVMNVSDDGMTDELWQLVSDDGEVLSKINAVSDRDRNLYFYLDNFYDDLCDEFDYPCAGNRTEVLQSAFEKLRHKKEVDLTDIRKAIYRSLRQLKIAYPNIKGAHGGNAKPTRDIMKWVQALGSIRGEVQSGKDKEEAIQRITEGWSPMEKLDFSAWARYYENGDHEKYKVRKSAAEVPTPDMPEDLVPPPPVKDPTEVPPVRRGPGRPRKTKKTLEQSKHSLIGRLDSAGKLLREFANVWPADVWTRLSEALSDLKREIIPLKTMATARDRIIRTANIFDKEGFSEGAEILRKVAQPPGGDLASKIEKALTGREYDIKGETPPAGGGAGEMPGMEDMMGGLGEIPPPPGGEAGMEAPPGGEAGMEPPPAGAEESLPPPPETPPAEEESAKTDISGENPFSGKNVQDVLDVLEPLSKRLSEREFVRALSKADMMLDGMNVASHFPELGEAQAKALELNLYVGTRLEKIINKLKGGLKGKGEEKEESAPEVEMGEFSKEPGKEKEMFEVTEEAPPAEAPPAAPPKAPAGT